MTTIEEYQKRIKWGTYSKYSGPWTRGVYRFSVGKEPDFTRKLLATITATEGGRYGAINMYDRCILSVGLIQWCEAANLFLVSKMFAKIASAGNYEMLRRYLKMIDEGLDFRRNSDGHWRFFLDDTEVASKAMQRKVFFGGATGIKGEWTVSQKDYAKLTCAVMSMVWQEPSFRRMQEDYTGGRLLGFAMPKSKKILFPENFPTQGWEGALRAAFISFAANLPVVADKHFRIAHEKYGSDGIEKLTIEALKEMTFGPGISIYPHRYNGIRPVLEKQFGIDLPDFAKELEQFELDNPWAELYPTTAHFQDALIKLGHDLGPSGSDNVMGKLTKAAIAAFEKEHGLEADGKPDMKFAEALAKAVDEAREDEIEIRDDEQLPPDADPEDEKPFKEPDPAVPDVRAIPPATDGHSSPPPPLSEHPEKPASKTAVKATGIVAVIVALLAALGRLLGWY